MNIENRMTGQWRILRQDRVTGEWLKPLPISFNTILNAGKEDFLNHMAGLGSPSVWNTTNADLKIYSVAPALVKTVQCTSVVHGADDSGSVVYTFEDISVDVYDANRLDLYNSASTVLFSQNAEAYGTKPASQNWIYEYTLTITQNGDSEILMDGMDRALRIFTGDQNNTDVWDALAAELRIENQARTASTPVNLDATYPQRAAQTLTWVFTSGVGQHLVEWYYLGVAATFVGAGETLISETDEAFDTSPGVKPSNVAREYTFTFSL